MSENSNKKKCPSKVHHVFEPGKRTCICGKRTVEEPKKLKFTDMYFK